MPYDNSSFNLAPPELVYAGLVPPAEQGDTQRQLVLDSAATMVTEARSGALTLDTVLGLDLPPTSGEDQQAFRRNTVVAVAGILAAGAYRNAYVAAQGRPKGDATSSTEVGRSKALVDRLVSSVDRPVPAIVGRAAVYAGLAATIGSVRYPARPKSLSRVVMGPRRREQPVNYQLVLKTLQSQIQLPDAQHPVPIDSATMLRNTAILEQMRILPQVVPKGKHGQTILF